MLPELRHRDRDELESPEQHKKLKSIFKHFLDAEEKDKKINLIAEAMDTDYNTVLIAIIEGLNRKWK